MIGAAAVRNLSTNNALWFPQIIYVFLTCSALSITLYTLFFLGVAFTEISIIQSLAEPLTLIALAYIPSLWTEPTGFGSLFTIQSTIKWILTIWAIIVFVKKFLQAYKKGFKAKEIYRPITVVKLAKVWVSALVLTCLAFPASYALTTNTKSLGLNVGETLGVCVWVYGFVVHVASVIQKYFFKKKFPGDFVSGGLWKYCRYPDIHGELAMWLGLFLISVFKLEMLCTLFVFLVSPVISFTGVYFLSGGVRSKDKCAEEKYGHRQEYVLYKHSTFSIFPKVNACCGSKN